MTVGAVGPVPFTPPTVSTATTAPASGSGFADALQQVSGLTQQADGLATGIATGELTDLHQFTTAAAKASLAVELTASVRNRAVEAYQEIMRMQV